MKKLKFLLFILLLISCTYLISCSSDPYDSLRKGMKYEKVVYYLGEPDDEELLGMDGKETYKACYWFKGAGNKEEAKANTEAGIPVTYVCVMFTSTNDRTWRIKEKADICKGIWGVS